MSRYKNSQYKRQEELIRTSEIFDADDGNGYFKGRPRAFVLKDGMNNLYGPIRDGVLMYFKENGVSWWGGFKPSKTVDMTVADQDIILDILLAILGDIDGNELVTRDDVINLLLHVTMPNRFPLNAEADFDGDGRVTRDDVIRLLLHVTMPNRFPLAN